MSQDKTAKAPRRLKKKNLVIGAVIFVAAIVAAYGLTSWSNNLTTQTNIILSHVKPECYVYFPNKNNTDPSSAQVAYYKSVADNITSSGIKYTGPFLRSPAFTEWLFNNCPLYNGTQSIYNLTSYNPSFANQSSHINPSVELENSVTSEQKMLHYNYRQNPDNFVNVFQVANHFNTDLQSTIDNMFMAGALNIDGLVTKDGTANGTALSECHNPSWRENSTLRQCSIYNSTIVVNKDTQYLMVQPMQSICKVSSCTINGTLVMPPHIAKIFGR